MAEQPTAGTAKVVKDALPAPSSKPGGNPAFRMMGESIEVTWRSCVREKEAGTRD